MVTRTEMNPSTSLSCFHCLDCTHADVTNPYSALATLGTEMLQKPSNAHNLLDRAKQAAMNAEQGLDNFTVPALEKF